jgi:hypothetical protein
MIACRPVFCRLIFCFAPPGAGCAYAAGPLRGGVRVGLRLPGRAHRALQSVQKVDPLRCEDVPATRRARSSPRRSSRGTLPACSRFGANV